MSIQQWRFFFCFPQARKRRSAAPSLHQPDAMHQGWRLIRRCLLGGKGKAREAKKASVMRGLFFFFFLHIGAYHTTAWQGSLGRAYARGSKAGRHDD